MKLGTNDWMMTLHWTGGGHRCSDLDRKHYNYIVEADGTIIEGDNSAEDQRVTSDEIYGQHTARLNTRNLGIAICGMMGAKENPLDFGAAPITEHSFRVAIGLMAKLAGAFAIPVDFQRIITHAEAEPNLGVKQAGKWDISVLPWNPDYRGARQVGDYMRSLIKAKMAKSGVKVKMISTTPSTVQIGSRGQDVGKLQDDLARLGYFNGRRDDHFGPIVRAAVLAFQADNGLLSDGIVGPQTWSAIETAQPRALRPVFAADLRARGSTTLASTDLSTVMTAGGGAVATATILTEKAQEASQALSQAQGTLDAAQGLLVAYWPLLLAVSLFAVAIYAIRRIAAARVADAQSGAHLGR